MFLNFILHLYITCGCDPYFLKWGFQNFATQMNDVNLHITVDDDKVSIYIYFL